MQTISDYETPRVAYLTPPSNIKRDKTWLIAELDMAEALFDKVVVEARESPTDELTEDMIPNPEEFLETPMDYIELWDAHVDKLLESFKETHAESLLAEKKEKEKKLEKYTLSEDEYNAKRIAELDEIPFIIPDKFYEDRKQLDTFLKCTFSSYISLLGGLYKIMESEFADELAMLTAL